MSFGRIAVLAAVLVTMALPAQAFAQAPTASQYSDTDISAIGDPGDPVDPADPGSHATGGSLPFSGSELIYAALVGTGLVGLGLGMRRLTRAPSTG